MAIELRPLRDPVDLAAIRVPTLLVAGGEDRNSEQAISEEAIATIGSPDKRFVAIPNATHLAVEFFREKLARAASGAVSGSVPATLALALDGTAAFDPFVPGVTREYTATTGATVTSTAGEAALPPAAWTAPVSGARVAITFKQAIGASDALRTGTYSRMLTFTLSTVNP